MEKEDLKKLILEFLYESSVTVTRTTLEELDEYIDKLPVQK